MLEIFFMFLPLAYCDLNQKKAFEHLKQYVM